jgi:hypothetical protein
MGRLLILQELDEVGGEEAFPDAAFAVDDEINLFLHGQMVLGSAMRGVPVSFLRSAGRWPWVVGERLRDL